MKVVILAGGLGTRISEETDRKPKPMVEIGGRPIIWHIMKHYSMFGFSDFIILLGYKGYVIKEFFFNYYLHQSDLTLDLRTNEFVTHQSYSEAWKITFLETGLETMTGGRIKKAQQFLKDERFLLTYGDGLSNVSLNKLVEFHCETNVFLTMTAVQPEGRYGALNITENGQISSFVEKPRGDGSWINGGFFVCEPEIFEFIENDQTVFEQEPLSDLATAGKLAAYKHDGFWQCMDTLRDKNRLNDLWDSGKPPWVNIDGNDLTLGR